MDGDYGMALTVWLNESRDAKARKEFSEAIRFMNTAASRVSGVLAQSRDKGNWRSRAADLRFLRAQKQAMLYSPLIITQARAQFVPTRQDINFEAGTYTLDNRWRLEWYYPGERRQAAGFKNGYALRCLIALAEDGTLFKVRECRHCGQWFYARSSQNWFCSKKCQQAHYWKSPEWKAHRREYMRRYRREHRY